MFPRIQEIIDKIDFATIRDSRKDELKELADFIQEKREKKEAILLNYVCTHNSRRSQFSQLWSQVAADYYGINVQSFSAGVEVTACNERTIASLERFGFQVRKEGSENPHYHIKWSKSSNEIVLYSKLLEEKQNPISGFAAIMTCSHADENCPLVLGCEKRIAIRYEDPKTYDDTILETTFYDYRSFEIATELFYVFSQVR